MEEKQVIFDEFMNEFVKLSTQQKNSEIIEKLKMMLAMVIKYANENNIDYTFLKSKEIIDIYSYKGTNEDYLEAMMVYLHNLEEVLGIIINNQIGN